MSEIIDKEKDLLFKIDILKKALLMEKQKVSILENENNELKTKLEKFKQSEEFIKTITQTTSLTSNSICSKGSIKSAPSRLVPLSVNEYENMLTHYEVQNENLKLMLSESFNSITTIKSSFQDVISKTQIRNKNLDEENKKLQDSIITLRNQNKIYEVENNSLETNLKNTINDFKELREIMTYTQSENQQLLKDKKKAAEYNGQLVENIKKLKDKLDNMKKIFLEDDVKDIEFTGEKKEVLKKKKVGLLFTSFDGVLSLIISYEGGHEKKIIPLDQFESARILNSTERQIELKYFKDQKDKKVKTKEYSLDQSAELFINSYKDYSAKASRLKINRELFHAI